MPLSPKQKAFADAYVRCKNATEAAREAGYGATDGSAKSQGSRLLTHADVRKEIDRGIAAQQDAANKESVKAAKKIKVGGHGITKERWLRELAYIAFADMDDYAKITDRGVKLIPTEERRKKHLGKAIKSVKESYSMSGGSQGLELHAKQPALETLGKHFGWVKDSMELSGNVGDGSQPTVNSETLDAIKKDPEAARLARALALRVAKGDKENGKL